MNFFASVGRATLDLLREIGRISIFTADAVTSFARPPIYWSLVGKQIMRIGFFSLPVVGLTAFFTGAVLALQIYIGTARYGAEQFVPTVVLIAILRELGPVIAGLMVAGRVAAAIAAALGTMRVTEQLDALTTLATRPIKYLVVPRLMAALISMPILVAIADAIGVLGGYVAAKESLGFTGSIYLNTTMAALATNDILSGLYKAVAFGFLIALMGTYNGFNSKGGAQGVGAATTNAVVSASILILVFNYILTNVFNLLNI